MELNWKWGEKEIEGFQLSTCFRGKIKVEEENVENKDNPEAV